MTKHKLFSALIVALVATGFVASSVTWNMAFAESKNQGGGPGNSGPGDKNPPGNDPGGKPPGNPAHGPSGK